METEKKKNPRDNSNQLLSGAVQKQRCKVKENEYIWSKGNSMKNVSASPVNRGLNRKNFFKWSKFFHVRVDFFLEDALCTGHQMRNHKTCLPL